MTELEKIERAKIYIDKLADGINPIDDLPAPDDDLINNVRLSRCFFYISDILRKLIENGGIHNVANRVSEKSDFFLTNEQRNQYVPSKKPISVSEITKSINSIANLEKCNKLKYSQITAWLIEIGALTVQNDSNGNAKKRPTSQGEGLGISTEIRNGEYGVYQVVVYNEEAQQFIMDNLDAIISFSPKGNKSVAVNKGQPWTQEQEECLINLYNQNVSIPEIANTLMRTKAGINARLEKLGLIEKIDT